MIAHPPNTRPTAPDPSGANKIVHQRRAGMAIAIAEHSGLREFHISVTPIAGESTVQTFRRLSAVLKEYDATIVRQEVFGNLHAEREAISMLVSVFGSIAWPFNWIEGGNRTAEICGTHVMAVSRAAIQPIRVQNKTIGCVYADKSSRHCILGNIVPTNIDADPAAQTEEVYQQLESALAGAGMKITDVVRTWFFLDHILDWYGDFNKVRNAFYCRQQPRPKFFPASTGISGRNPNSSALSVAVWAMQPLNEDASAGEVLSPLQCPAPDYGSGFSRAAEIVTPEYRRVFVSGTASIYADGQSAYPNDIDQQVELTMEVVEAMLRSRNMTFSDVTRATLYFKDITQAASFPAWCRRKQLDSFPAIATEAHVCRGELLFEIELDAILVHPLGS